MSAAAADSSCGELSKRCNEMRSTVAALYERRSSSRQQRSAVADRRYRLRFTQNDRTQDFARSNLLTFVE